MELKKAKEIISKSGNSFHCRVAKRLASLGWTIQICPYFNDNITGKPREIDLIAEKVVKINDSWGNFSFHVSIKIYIECKYLVSGTVFWFNLRDQLGSSQLIERTTRINGGNAYMNEHHYLAHAYVAKLFADENPKGTEGEVFFKALNQSLNALIYYRDRGSIIRTPRIANSIRMTLNYPVIVCSELKNLYRVNIDDETDPVIIDKPFMLEVDYAYVKEKSDDVDEYFLIDVADLSTLESLLKQLEHDAQITGFLNRTD